MQDIKAILIAVMDDCRTFLNDYFYNGITAGAVLAVLYCIILWYQFICSRGITKDSIFNACIKIPFVALLGFYCYLVLGITILSRSKGTAYILSPVPFSTWGTDPWSLTLWTENILMMVPLGILLYIIWKPFRKIGWSVFAGFSLSLLIECIQFFTRLGKFETDDIMNNVLGALTGFLLCKSVHKIFLAAKGSRFS